ncbi:MAG: hypothetical protein QOE61_897 [Micromonosporaceae bacterium]|jgi:hypothetical protein|nr:hypothetical protein [Micromonosporaceae bacterium]
MSNSRKKRAKKDRRVPSEVQSQRPASKNPHWWSWFKTPVGALVGGLLTVVVTVTAAFLNTATTNAAQTKLDQVSGGPWLRLSVLPVDSTQLGYVSSSDRGTPAANGVDHTADMDLEKTMFKIQLTGLSHSGVRIYGGRIRIHKRTDPRPGVVYLPIPPQGGDRTIGLTADLDEANPGLRDADDEKSLYFQRHDVTLAFGEHQILTMTAKAERTAVDWDLELSLQRDGDDKKSTMALDNGGRPWVTTAVRPGMRGYTAAYDQKDFDSWQRHADVEALCRATDRLRQYCGGGQ